MESKDISSNAYVSAFEETTPKPITLRPK